jgi:hypothetical protein
MITSRLRFVEYLRHLNKQDQNKSNETRQRMKTIIFLDVTPSRLVYVYRNFKGMHSLSFLP